MLWARPRVRSGPYRVVVYAAPRQCRRRPRTRPDPAPGPGEVLVRVEAAGVDRGTWHVMTGRPLVARLALGLRSPKDRIPGRDVAGTVHLYRRSRES